MEKSDFEFVMDDCEQELLRSQNGIRSANTRLWEILEDWPGLVKNYYSKVAAVEVDKSSEKVSGTVLGKQFRLSFNVIAEGGTSHIEAILCTKGLVSGEVVESGRFLISPYGAILDTQKGELLSRDDEFLSYKLLASILRKVAALPAGL
jgi:hypothetical protein